VLTWSRFDNASGGTSGEPIETRAVVPRAQAPSGVLTDANYVTVAVRTVHPDYPHWQLPATFTFRRMGDGWQAVGLERMLPPRVY
jgi:hypothetical protein